MGLDNFAQVILGDMGIDLGRGNVGMAEQSLDDAQISPAFKQMRGEGVAQDVGADAGWINTRVERRLI